MPSALNPLLKPSSRSPETVQLHRTCELTSALFRIVPSKIEATQDFVDLRQHVSTFRTMPSNYHETV